MPVPIALISLPLLLISTLISCCRGNGLGASDWQGILYSCELARITKLNGLAWSPQRSAAVQSDLGLAVCQKTAAHIDLR